MSKAAIKSLFQEKLTRQVRATIKDDAGAKDPVALQYLYDAREDILDLYERNDPIGDNAHSPVPAIVHRYPDRALLKITDICAVHCRYCFRKEMLQDQAGVLSPDTLESALSYLRATPAIREIILTGGDPLTLALPRLASLLKELEAIEHLDIIRIHTRIPIVQPSKIDAAMTKVFSDVQKAFFLVIHVNHVQEINAEAQEALLNLSRTGAVLLSQSVLLKDVNDSAQVLEALFRKLLSLRVKPYYLHHPDLVKGSGHFQVSFEKGQDIMKDLRGRVSGLAQPHYVLDIPGGFGKMPLTPSSLQKDAGGNYTVEDYKGVQHAYPRRREE
jgi:lysine 2,3-aminomutase